MTTLTGTGLLLRQAFRRDRIVVPVSLAVLTLMTYASASATETIFASAQERVRLAHSINGQPGLTALYGPILDPSSVGELAMSKMTVLYALVSTILYVVLVRRHTRVEEETGRAELAGGTAIGRDAPMAAAAIESLAVASALGMLVFTANAVAGLPVTGSLWFGVSWFGTGAVATAVAAVACQLSASARTCGAIAAGLLGGAFVVRAIGDAVEGAHWLVWWSPLGWNTQLRAWSEPRWWVVGLYVGLTAALLMLAQTLHGRRDIGAGMVHARPGPSEGRLRGPGDLVLRLHRTSFGLWIVAMASMGAMFGAMSPGFDDLLSGTGGSELIARLGGTFIAVLLSVAAMAVTCFPVSLIAAAHAQEATGLTGLVLSTQTSRTRWFGSIALFAFAGAAGLLLVVGVTTGAGFAAAGGGEGSAAVRASLGWVPAVWFVVAVAFIGLALGLDWVGWAAVALFATMALIGDLLELPPWFVNLSPYAATPSYPAEPWSWTPTVSLLVLTAALVGAAWWRLERRDIA